MYLFVLVPVPLFPENSVAGHLVPHRADSLSLLLSGLKQVQLDNLHLSNMKVVNPNA